MVERFSQSPVGEEPYFARARMDERSAHASRLSHQVLATEKTMNK